MTIKKNDYLVFLLMPSLWMAALGYFVDIYDLVLFGVVRVNSLKALGVSGEQLLSAGTTLLNYQMGGMLIGGFIWGFYGDHSGRKKMLFGSILIYSLANIANAFVTDINQYALCRLIAGFGLSGELGAAVTLISEKLPQRLRGLGSIFIGSLGFLGALAASSLGGLLPWNYSYLLGGTLGIVLLILRLNVTESEVFLEEHQRRSKSLELTAKEKTIGSWDSVIDSLKNLRAVILLPANMWRYLRLYILGVPIWYTAGLLIYFSPEFAKELKVLQPIEAGQAIFWSYLGSIAGDLVGGVLGQLLRSRKKVLLLFVGTATLVFPCYFFLLREVSAIQFYGFCFLLGLVNGHATLFVGYVAENFSTSVRATAATSITNLVRAAVIPMNFIFQYLRPQFGLIYSGLFIGVSVSLLALASLLSLNETFHISLQEKGN